MSGYDLFVAPINREVIDAKAWAFRYAFGADDAWAPDIARILEHELPKILSGFALRVLSREAMPADEARTHHSVPAIDIREDIYERLCDWDGRARMTGRMSWVTSFCTTENLARALSWRSRRNRYPAIGARSARRTILLRAS